MTQKSSKIHTLFPVFFRKTVYRGIAPLWAQTYAAVCEASRCASARLIIRSAYTEKDQANYCWYIHK